MFEQISNTLVDIKNELVKDDGSCELIKLLQEDAARQAQRDQLMTSLICMMTGNNQKFSMPNNDIQPENIVGMSLFQNYGTINFADLFD